MALFREQHPELVQNSKKPDVPKGSQSKVPKVSGKCAKSEVSPRKPFTHEVEIQRRAQEAPDEWLSQVPPGSLVEQGAERGAPEGAHGRDQ